MSESSHAKKITNINSKDLNKFVSNFLLKFLHLVVMAVYTHKINPKKTTKLNKILSMTTNDKKRPAWINPVIKIIFIELVCD